MARTLCLNQSIIRRIHLCEPRLWTTAGWVMSDWGATHSTSIMEGLDQEMPSDQYMGDSLISAVKNGSIPQSAVDDSVRRILLQMFVMGVFDREQNGTRPGDFNANVTSAAHNLLARRLAAESTVLLKNEGLLPIRMKANKTASEQQQPTDSVFTEVSTIVVLGPAGYLQPVVHGSGSGRVQPPYVVSGFEGIQARARNQTEQFRRNIAVGSMNGGNCTFDVGYDYNPAPGQLGTVSATDAADCCAKCAADSRCFYWTFRHKQNKCWKKVTNLNRIQKHGVTSGSCVRPPIPPPPAAAGVSYDKGTDNLQRAASLAGAADVAVVFAATASGEGHDRPSLALNADEDALIEAVAAVQRNTVVVINSPGAVLLPWADHPNVSAVLAAFMPGQEAGNAIADVSDAS